jgi:serine/threonine protein phosphatase PrpC
MGINGSSSSAPRLPDEAKTPEEAPKAKLTKRGKGGPLDREAITGAVSESLAASSDAHATHSTSESSSKSLLPQRVKTSDLQELDDKTYDFIKKVKENLSSITETDLTSIKAHLKVVENQITAEKDLAKEVDKTVLEISNSVEGSDKIGKTELNKMKVSIRAREESLAMASKMETCAHSCQKLAALLKNTHLQGLWKGLVFNARDHTSNSRGLLNNLRSKMQGMVMKYESTRTASDAASVTAKLHKELQDANEVSKLTGKTLDVDFEHASETSAVVRKKDTIGKKAEAGSYKAGYTSLQNYKSLSEESANEDRIVVADLKIGKKMKLPLFAVYDGHGGAETSQFVSEKLNGYLEQELAFLSTETEVENLDEKIFNAFKRAFIRCNEALHRSGASNDSGSTASVAIIIKGDIWVANAGDSRVLISDPNKGVIALSEDATPQALTEDDKFAGTVLKRGGTVFKDRDFRIVGTAGALASFRAFGDFHALGMSASPKIVKHSLNELSPGAKLVVACDGIFDAASSNDVHEYIKKAALKGKKDPDIASSIALKARHVTEPGKQAPTAPSALRNVDDISIIVVGLKV